jgi:hypothetical protein
VLPVALLIGLDLVQGGACRSALKDRARVFATPIAQHAVTFISLHRPLLVVMRGDLGLDDRRRITELTVKIGGRIASISPDASASSVEHLIDGFAVVAFTRSEERLPSGIRPRTAPGQYHFSERKKAKR